MEQHFVGIDIGTTSICAVVYNPLQKTQKAITRSNKAKLKSANSWEDIQDPDEILAIAKNMLDDICRDYQNTQAIGVTGQMHGILYVDENGDAVSPLYTWQDGRGDLPFKDDLTYATYISKQTGYPVATGFGMVTHFFNLKNNQVPQKAAKICTIMDFVAMKLAHKSVPVIDTTNAASLSLFDLERLNFDATALKCLYIDRDMLPAILPTGEPIGFYGGKIQVCNALGDNQASILGAVQNVKETILVNIGTSSQVSVYSENYLAIDGIDVRPFPGGGYVCVGSALTGGYSLEVLKNAVKSILEVFADESTVDETFYKVLNTIDVDAFDESEALEIDVSFRGSRTEPNRRGSIENISVSNFNLQNLFFGFAKGIVNESNHFYQKFPDAVKAHMNYLVGSGNAIRFNPVLVQLIERTHSKKMQIPRFLEEAAFGACLSAMAGTKAISDFHAAGDFISY